MLVIPNKYYDLLFCRDKTNETTDEPTPVPAQPEKKSIFNPLPLSNKAFSRPRFRNYSHISEFGDGLEVSSKSHKKRDKVDVFLEKKRERNTTKRLLGRHKT